MTGVVMVTTPAVAEVCYSSGPSNGEALEPVLLSELVLWKSYLGLKKNRKLPRESDVCVKLIGVFKTRFKLCCVAE